MITPLDCGSCCSWIAKLSNRAISSSHFMSPNSSKGRVTIGEPRPVAQIVRARIRNELRIINDVFTQPNQQQKYWSRPVSSRDDCKRRLALPVQRELCETSRI